MDNVIDSSELRQKSKEVLNRVKYNNEIFFIARHGKIESVIRRVKPDDIADDAMRKQVEKDINSLNK